jgi:fucose 4-O-acetylase-like acetyltransferase
VSPTRPASIAGAWARARELAQRTPAERNRYADFLRAASIGVVVIGHWLMATPSVERGAFTLSDMLRVAPWTQWLTWVFQVMPVFFLVGGYANAASWQKARDSGEGYDVWISRRLQRLVRPMIPVVLVWSGIALAARALGANPRAVDLRSQVALVPIWFLAVYVMIVVVAPATHRLWRRHGIASFWMLAAGAAAVDAAVRASGIAAVGWLNFALVWLAIHQLGHAWRDGWFARPARTLPWAVGGLVALGVLVGVLAYPVSMITVPGEPASNSSPPSAALLALGVLHAGLVLAAERPFLRLLRRPGAWTAVVFVNGAIMTLYLWHATAMVALVELTYLLGIGAFAIAPNSPAWWATRPLWILALLLVLSAFVSVLGGFEASVRRRASAAPPAWRSVAGALALCAGLAALAIGGIEAPGRPALRGWPLALTLAGAILVAAVRLPRLSRGPRSP